MGMPLGLVLLGLLQVAPETAPAVPPQLAQARVEAAQDLRGRLEEQPRSPAAAGGGVLSLVAALAGVRAGAEQSQGRSGGRLPGALGPDAPAGEDQPRPLSGAANPIEEATAAEFYSLEAEIWFTQAKKK